MSPNLKMLSVEDDAELRQSLHQQFTAEGFEVDGAEDGDIALEMLKHKQYDVVLLDLKLKRMDGKAVLKEMKKINAYPHVIVLTAIDDVKTALECIKLGAEDYISKPYDPEELLHIVIKVLSA